MKCEMLLYEKPPKNYFGNAMNRREYIEKAADMVQFLIAEAQSSSVTPYRMSMGAKLSKSTVSNLQHKKQNPTLATVLMLADFLNYDVVFVPRAPKIKETPEE